MGARMVANDRALSSSQRVLLQPRWDKVVELLAFLDADAQRRVCWSAARRVAPIVRVWTGESPDVAVRAVLTALEQPPPEAAQRSKLAKRVGAAHRLASKAAGYNRKTGQYTDSAARAAAAALQVVSYCCRESPEEAGLPFAWCEAVVHAGGGFAAAEAELENQLADVRELEASQHDSADWSRRFEALWQRWVPAEGPADTSQGELLRALGALADEALRNGNVNYGPRHRAMAELVRAQLLDDGDFDELQRRSLQRAFHGLDTGEVIRDSSHRILARFAVRWCEARGFAC